MSYIFFYGHNPRSDQSHIFSQWFESDFLDNGVQYFCMEQYMMAQKALLFQDQFYNSQIMKSRSPKEIKSLGRQIRNFNQSLWDTYKYNIVVQGNYLKFSQNSQLKEILLNTKDKILVEASPYDRIWGIGLSASDALKTDPSQWPGENLLGKALMQVRGML